MRKLHCSWNALLPAGNGSSWRRQGTQAWFSYGKSEGFKGNYAAVKRRLSDKGIFRSLKAWSLTNIGVRPTFGKKERSVEVYLFDLEKDLYNKELKVCFITKIRNEMAFPDSRALACRIKKDIAKAKSIIKNAEPAKKQNLTFSC